MPEHIILIVDDEPNVLKSLKRLLLDTDYRILTADSGETGLEIFENSSIDVVISDYRMPGMNGVEFLTKVKEKSPNTMRLILSGYADAIAMVEAINEGQVYRFITKPWNDQELLTTITTSVEQHNLQVENSKLYFELQSSNTELQNLTKSLEKKVSQRTHDIEIKNRALMMARNILSYLPIGVIGIDSEFMVVYMNESLEKFLGSKRLGLGLNAEEILDNNCFRLMEKAFIEQNAYCCACNLDNDIVAIWSPLPNHNGIVGTFSYSKFEKFVNIHNREVVDIGASNG